MSAQRLVLLCLLFLASGCTSLQQESTGGADRVLLSAQDLRDTLSKVRRAIVELEEHRQRPRHCLDLLDGGDKTSGVRRVFPFRASPDVAADVYCDQETDGGGWTVFQRRLDLPNREDFFRTWVEYELGFGRMDGGEFWLGLDLLHHLTAHNLQELRVDLEDFDGNTAWAKYGLFHVGGAATNYRLNVGRYSGTAGDSFHFHNGSPFSTHDADHEKDDRHCAQEYRGAWWYNKCHNSNLNGYQHKGRHESYADGIHWNTFKGYYYSLKSVQLMIRPAF